MKSNFFKKLAVFLGLAVGAFTMTACQSTSIDSGSVKFEMVSAEIFRNEKNEKYVLITSKVSNNTIYDIRSWDYTLVGTIAGDPTEYEVRVTDVEFYVQHGAGGTVSASYKLPTERQNLTSISYKDCVPNRVLNGWETYLGWWICGIVIVALSWIFFAAEIIGRKLTSDQIMEVFRENAGGTLCVGLFIFILCMFPLFFGAWVPTVILVCALLAGIIGCGIIAAIASAISKKKA